MSVEWRYRHGLDALLQIDRGGEAIAEAAEPEAGALRAYLAVTGNLEHWRQAMAWREIDGASRDPAGWGELVVSREDSGEITFLDPERFWDGVYRWFRSRGVDYNT